MQVHQQGTDALTASAQMNRRAIAAFIEAIMMGAIFLGGLVPNHL
jgi:hypothetical protein